MRMMRAVAAGTVALGLAMPADLAAQAPDGWATEVPSGRVEAAVRRDGKRESLVVTVHPGDGVTIEPAVLRVDVPALMRDRLTGRFPTTVRGAGKGGAMRAALPVARPGAVRFGTLDSNDGTLRVEYRYCTKGRPTCAVERIDVPLKMAP